MNLVEIAREAKPKEKKISETVRLVNAEEFGHKDDGMVNMFFIVGPTGQYDALITRIGTLDIDIFIHANEDKINIERDVDTIVNYVMKGNKPQLVSPDTPEEYEMFQKIGFVPLNDILIKR